jgi:catalase (peroxidase I)
MDWVLIEGPGGNLQWASNMTMDMSMRNMSMRNMSMRNMNMNMTDRTGTTPTPLFMLTTDIALSEDPIYKPISEGYAADIKSLEHDFGHVWYRLMTSDMGPWDRCVS